MEWRDEGIIIGCRRHGEGSVIVEIMTPSRGRCMGLVRGGRSSRMRALLQPGNSVQAHWRARLEEHLGTFTLEAVTLRAATLMEMPLGIYGLQTLASHLRLLPERDPHPGLYQAVLIILDHLEDPEITSKLIVRFEMVLLEELGVGLDLSHCASTGQKSDLIYVSPKSGRAVSRDAGKPWADKMLSLPTFLRSKTPQISLPVEANPAEGYAAGELVTLKQDVRDGFSLSGYFLDRHVYAVRDMRTPDERIGLIKAIEKQLKKLGTKA